MIEYIIICVTAFGVAILTFFSGFGLGTILTPIFMLFFPAELAIALTGVVHFFNNIFKLILVHRNIDRNVLLFFGLPAIIAAYVGAWLLVLMPTTTPLYSYSIGAHTFHVYPVKCMVAILLIIFATIELLPFTKKLSFPKNQLPLGGFLSGFFGGLSGNQGALRSAFLINAGLSKAAFIGTTVAVSTLVDVTRLSVYSTQLSESGLAQNIYLILAATIAGISGSYIGNKLLKKVTISFIQTLVAVLLIILSICMGLGLI